MWREYGGMDGRGGGLRREYVERRYRRGGGGGREDDEENSWREDIYSVWEEEEEGMFEWCNKSKRRKTL